MSVGNIPVGKIIVRAVEAVLAAWIIKDALRLYHAGKPDAAVNNAILAVEMVAVVEALLWLVPRLVTWAEKKWHMSSDEV
jgi:membrane protein YdbS with pleckstrin-like domain